MIEMIENISCHGNIELLIINFTNNIIYLFNFLD
jgi:hypothetical protein